MGKLNWTDLTGLAGICADSDFTVSMTFKHRATVVEMADWSLSGGLEVAGKDDGSIIEELLKGCEELEEFEGGAASGCPTKSREE